ncbi:MAG TPA: type 2 isopentenyl-diphosphate Delta-isomerase [Syntrophomonadaceae bacterium]|nr:type 2 isopentenyl-diphosphate Delta-isomerase [Syntrophomonadaceae bacterium]HOQ09885.1 type 2 isopentenyl-diphosphate Delta-isomerase [Syntrophomonadaceae bacterium]HPU48085.1 type 2 isopentenyl-diphosphate Delta-isomerase [Syntrophomonadaceae bacterium]
MRSKRKADHIRIASRLEDGPSTNGFEDISLLNDSVPELSLADIDLSCEFLSKNLTHPLIINAITGGTDEARRINRSLAALTRKYGLAMAVGSQTLAIHEPSLRPTFSVVREENPDGVILANVSALSPIDEALQAVEMVKADGLQLHFNVAQELAMPEGDRDFRGVLDNVARLVKESPVPVIAKEVGFGFSREAAEKLLTAGIQHFDIGGKGGTNFVAIEDQRQGLFAHEFDDWGIPTAVSLAELLTLEKHVHLTATGGIRTALDGVKALAMGAHLIGMAGPLLKLLINEGESALENYLQGFLYRLKAGVLLAGANSIEKLQQKPVIISGKTAHWLSARGIDINRWARRG